jgi:Uma2 family endonuclease
MATIDALLTAEEFFQLPHDGQPKELSRGRIVYMTPPAQPHGLVCLEIAFVLRSFLQTHDLGRVVCNDSGFITSRRPDSVRGPDVSFYRHDQIPPKPYAAGYWNAVPPLVIEVLSPNDKRAEVLDKVSEYHAAGVTIACVVDPQTETVQVFYADRAPVTLSGEDKLRLPEVLGDEFAVPVKRFFE